MSARKHARRRMAVRAQRGGALVEYVIVTLLLVIVLIAAPDDVIHKLMGALKDAYASFTYALSVSWL